MRLASISAYTLRFANNAHTPAPESRQPPTRLKRSRAAFEERSRRADAANAAYSDALRVANTTNVTANVHSCAPISRSGPQKLRKKGDEKNNTLRVERGDRVRIEKQLPG